MYFKNIKSLLFRLLYPFFITILMIKVSGCGWFSSQRDKPDNQPIVFKLSQGECFKKIPNIMELYWQQNAIDPGSIKEISTCIHKAVVDFTSLTVGAESDLFYTDKEFSNFFKTYIFKRDLPVSFIQEVMKFKVGLVGGSFDSISKVEFEKIKTLLPLLEDFLIKIHPHIRVLLFRSDILEQKKTNETNDKDSVFSEAVESAISELKNGVNTLIQQFQFEKSNYSLNDLYQLLSEVENSFSAEVASDNKIKNWKQNIQSLIKFKTLLSGDNTEIKSNVTLTQVYHSLVEGLRLSLLFRGLIQAKEWTSKDDFKFIQTWMGDFLKLIRNSLEFRQSPEVPFAQIDDVLEVIHSRGVWLDNLNLETAKEFYRQFIKRFLNQDVQIAHGFLSNHRKREKPLIETFDNEDLESFTLNHFRNIEYEYLKYLEIQKGLQQIFKLKDNISIHQIRNELQKLITQKQSDKFSSNKVKLKYFYDESWSQFFVLIMTPIIRHWDSDGKVSMVLESSSVLNPSSSLNILSDSNSKSYLWSYQELSYLNLIRIPTALIFSAYGDHQNNENKSGSTLKKSLSVGHIRSIYNEFRKIGSELGLFDLRGEDTAARSTREADMFTPSGNGDTMIQFDELFDLFTIMWSGGEQGVSAFKKFSQIESCELVEVDYFKKPYLKMDCASNTLRRYFSKVFPNLDGFSKYIKTLDQKQWDLTYQDLLKVSQVCPSNRIGLETGDQRTMMVVFHYIETLFSLFDKNHDDFFDESEVEAAYSPRFHAFFLAQTGTQWWPNLSKDAFKFVVLKGYKPSKIELIDFKLSENKGKADRQKLVKVFASLKSEISKLNNTCASSNAHQLNF